MMSTCSRLKLATSSLAKRRKSITWDGVRLGHRQVRQADVVEIGVLHRPEHIAPGPVQGLGRLVALRQPVLKGRAGGVGVAERRRVAGIFVVRLPGRHMRVPAIALGQKRHDPRAFRPVAAMREAVVPARAEAARAAVLVQRQHVGVAVQHPARRGGSGRAKHHLQALGAKRLDRPVEPGPVEAARFRLHPAPGKFADAHPGQAHARPSGRHPRPIFLRPVFRIIADAKRAFHRMTCGSGRPLATPSNAKV